MDHLSKNKNWKILFFLHKFQNIGYLLFQFGHFWRGWVAEAERRDGRGVCLSLTKNNSNWQSLIQSPFHKGQFLTMLVAWHSFRTHKFCIFALCILHRTQFLASNVKNHFIKTLKTMFNSYFQITFSKPQKTESISDTLKTFQNLKNGVYFTFPDILI